MHRGDSGCFLASAYGDHQEDDDDEFLLIDDDGNQTEDAISPTGSQSEQTELNPFTSLHVQDYEYDKPAVVIQMQPVHFNDDDRKQAPRKSSMKKSSSYGCLTDEIPICMKNKSYKTLPKPDMSMVRSQSMASFFPPPQEDAIKPMKRNVSFSSVFMRNYPLVLGDNPSVSYGPPTTLAWEFHETKEVELEAYEQHRPPRRKPREMLMNYYQRTDILTKSGHSEQELKNAKRQAEKAKRQRNATKSLVPLMKLEDAAQSAARKAKRVVARTGSSETLSTCSNSTSLATASG